MSSMWGIGVAKASPKPPSISPPKESKYQKSVQNELEALRQRGLAKLLNKHFTSVTALIAAERAAADASIRELEEKRRLHKDFASNPSELSQWDKLYVELQQKRADCKRKEKETLLLYQRYVDKFGRTGAVAVPTKDDVGYAMNHSNARTNQQLTSQLVVGQMTEDIEATLAALVSKGADRHPSIKNLGVDESIQHLQAKTALDDAINSRKLLESRGVDAKATLTPDLSRKAHAEALCGSTPMTSLTTTDLSNVTLPSSMETDADEDSDERSAVSGLTSINSHIISDAELQLLNFLKTETEAIRQMIDQEEVMSVRSSLTSSTSDIRNESARAAQKAEQMVRQMEEMLQDFQVEEGEKTEETKSGITEYPYKLETSNREDNWIVYFDEEHEREYYYETNSNVVQWKKPSLNSGGDSTRGGDSVRTATPTDTDYMPMSDYTKRKPTNRLLSYAEVAPDLSYEEVTPDRRRGLPRDGGSSRRDLYKRKQRKRRKQRRVSAVICFLVAVGGGGYACRRYETDPVFAARVDDLRTHESVQLVFETVVSVVPGPVAEQARHLYDAVSPYLPDIITGAKRRAKIEAEYEAKRREVENEAKRREAENEAKRREAEMKAKEEAERKAKIKAELAALEKKAKEEKERIDAELKAKAEADIEREAIALKEKKKKAALAKKEKQLKAKEAARKAREQAAAEAQRQAEEAEEAERSRKFEEAARLAAEEKARRDLHRPWACNIPLAYIVHPRCRRLSSANPVFNLKELVDAMMQ